MNANSVMRLSVLTSGLLLVAPRYACAFDVLRVDAGISATPAAAIISDPAACLFGARGKPLLLMEAVQRALCGNPKTRQAWADVKVQAAGLGVARAAYLPSISANGQIVRDSASTDVTGHPNLSSATSDVNNSASVSLNWVLYDFGARAAAVQNASALLIAAQSTQNATLQNLFVSVAKDYYAAQAAEGALLVASEVERMAADNAHAAEARVDRGIAPISDALQAQTPYTQASIGRTKADGAWRTAVGALAADMNISPDTPMELPAVVDGVQPDANFMRSVGALMDEARRTHPSVVAAQVQVEAANAKVEQIRSEGLPSLSLVSKYSRNNQPASLGLGFPQYPASSREWNVGVQLNIPLFEGFGRSYQISEARARLERQQYALDDAREQVALEVWNSYQTVQTSTEILSGSATLLGIAQRAYVAAERRYRAGVGNILELLNTQTALANARQQRVQALTDWRAARLRFAGSLGRLGEAEMR